MQPDFAHIAIDLVCGWLFELHLLLQLGRQLDQALFVFFETAFELASHCFEILLLVRELDKNGQSAARL